MVADEMRHKDALRLPLDEYDAVREKEIAVGRFEITFHEALGFVSITEDVGQICHCCSGCLPNTPRRPAPKIAQIREVCFVRDVA
ncbi:hypothetical protein D3C86_1997560 [compost metagenome]